MDFNFNMPVKIVSGENALEKNKNLLLPFGKKCGILTGKSSAAKSGALGDVTRVLTELKIDYAVFDGISENPLIEDCRLAGAFFRKEKADFIFAIGGGSVLDAAKAAAIYASNETLSAEDIYIRKYDNAPLPVVLIGTSAGTGSEVSAVSVLTNGKTNRKKSISGADCYAKLVFADARYTESMPYSVTVSTALDAFSHAVEGYFTPKCTYIPLLFAEKAIPILYKNLKKLEETKIVPDKKAREEIYYGSLLAGMVLNPCGTAFPHPLGYVLTENYNIPHGKACTAFMTEFIDRAMVFEKEKSDYFFKLIGDNKEDFCKIIENLTELPEIKMTENEIEAYCSRWNDAVPGNFVSSPGGFSKADAVKIFTEKFLK